MRIIKFWLITGLLLGFSGQIFCKNRLPVVPANACNTLSCVRKGIDSVDEKIILLIKKRLDYVKRAGQLKKHTKSVHDAARETKILKTVAMQAEQAGYPGSIAKAVFKTILAQSNVYEKQFHHYAS